MEQLRVVSVDGKTSCCQDSATIDNNNNNNDDVQRYRREEYVKFISLMAC